MTTTHSMMTKRLTALGALAAGLLLTRLSAQPADTPEAAAAPLNLAVVADTAGSYVSGDTTLTALNDGATPRNSRDARHGSYGNWPRTGTQWVEYTWSRPISTKQIDVYWWIDGRGIGAPKACRLLYWDGQAFVPVTHASGLGVRGNQFETTTFDVVRTTRLKLEIDSDGTLSTGILEWKVYDAGDSPDFPPRVAAGVDRDVVLGGKTYLAGEVKRLKPAPASGDAHWSKASGPGEVTFADPRALATTATFSAPGVYTLKLSAGQGALTADSALEVKVVEPPPPDRLDVVYTRHYKVDSPLWSARIKALIVNWIPHCIDQINRTNLTRGQGGIDNFIEAAKALRGEPHGRHKGYVFANAWVHQTVESMCLALMVDPQGDPEILRAQNKMRATLEDWIPKILAAQEPDGYLQTAWTLRNPNGPWKERWSPEGRGNHEGYTAGYFIESAINDYTLTDGKDKRLYNAAKKLADCWYANLGPPPKKSWYDGHEEMEQALVRFGRFVNDVEGQGHGDHYIQLAKFLLDCRSTTSEPWERSEYDQSHLPVIEQYEAVGHAVRAVYLYSGMADVAAETHNTDYQSAVMSLWDNLVNRKYYITGGVGSGETSEGFGPDYSLRNNAYCEACSSCGEIFFQYKLNLAYHDAHYADLYEETLYNALLGSLALDGRDYYYDNPLDTYASRYPWHVCPCCVGNIPRTLLMLPTWTYAKSSDGLYVNLFIGSTVKVENIAGTDIEVVQKTDYPWSGSVDITLNPAKTSRFRLYLRVPNRSTSDLYTNTPVVDSLESLKVNGQAITPRLERGYAVIDRAWKRGDRVDAVFPMVVQRVRASARIAADRGKVALRYGPLIYNLERVDGDVSKPIDVKGPFTAEWRGDLLDGVTVINGQYADGSRLMAIPNFARDNRTASEPGGSTAAGNAAIDYSGASGASNPAPSAAPVPRGPASVVWLKAP